MTQSVRNEFTLVHIAAEYRHYEIVHYFIEEHGFNVDFYKPPHHRLTLLHVIAKFHVYDKFTPEEEVLIRKLIHKSNNLVLRNNFGKTVVSLAVSMNNVNGEFLRTEITDQIMFKMRGLAFIIDHALRKQNQTLNKYILRDIYKYVDG
jgi:hypothetical protein